MLIRVRSDRVCTIASLALVSMWGLISDFSTAWNVVVLPLDTQGNLIRLTFKLFSRMKLDR